MRTVCPCDPCVPFVSRLPPEGKMNVNVNAGVRENFAVDRVSSARRRALLAWLCLAAAPPDGFAQTALN